MTASSVFPGQRVDAIERLRLGPLAVASANYDFLKDLEEPYLWNKILAAEKEVERRLTIPLQPTEIFPDPPTSAELTALNGAPYIVEPGYDLPADFFGLEKWGALQLREKPVISVAWIKFVYPNQGGVQFEIPSNWIRLDNQYGMINLFPSALTTTTPLSVFVMQSFGAGHNVPLMIRVRYRAGLDFVTGSYPDIEDLVLRMAVLRILKDSLIGQSGSISADGLSESTSTDVQKIWDGYNLEIDKLREQLIGPVWSVI
ncbi:MAG: hypothetical protein ACU843_15165 [Gammaproteobacteria bacterium]